MARPACGAENGPLFPKMAALPAAAPCASHGPPGAPMPILALLQASGTERLDSAIESLLTLNGLVTHWQFWLWFTLVLLIAEILTSGFFIGAFAPATVVTSGAAALGLS